MATPSIERLAHVGLHVRDLQKSVEFYRDMVGLKISDDDKACLLYTSDAADDIL
jgi:catechol 2,3-dioxygenase-like lactoylglutathione lyase family enzyme